MSCDYSHWCTYQSCVAATHSVIYFCF